MKSSLPVLPDFRRDTRKVVRLRTTVADKLGLANGEVMNISHGGCGLRLTKRLTRGQYLKLKVYPKDRTKAVEITLARVKWVEADGAGVEFLSVSPQNHELHRLCTEQFELSLGA